MKKRSQASKKLKSGSISEPAATIHNKLLKTSVVSSEGDLVTITTANITKNIQNTTITLEESQLQKGNQDKLEESKMAEDNTDKKEQKKVDNNKLCTIKDLNHVLTKFTDKIMTSIQQESIRQDAKFDTVMLEVRESALAIKTSHDKLENHIQATKKQSEEFQKSLQYLEDNHNDVAQNQKCLTVEVKDLRFKLDNVISYIENDKRKKEKVTEKYYKNLLLNEIRNLEKKFKIKGFPYDKNANWDNVELHARDIIYGHQQKANTQEQQRGLNNIQMRKKESVCAGI